MPIKLGLVDDHKLFLESLVTVFAGNEKIDVVLKALNGKDLREKMETAMELPEVVLVDVNMPQMDGYETVMWVKDKYPDIKMIALSMKDDDRSIIRMLKAGCCSYLLKDISPDELEVAIESVAAKGFYNNDTSNMNFSRLLQSGEKMEAFTLSDREMRFLTLVCSEMTYKEIASKMDISDRTVDTYRVQLFEKFHVQSRIGLCLEALRQDLVKL